MRSLRRTLNCFPQGCPRDAKLRGKALFDEGAAAAQLPAPDFVGNTAPPLASCLLAHCDRHLTMKQATVGNLIFGGAWSAATDPATGRTRILRESLEGNLWVAERVLPGVAGLHVLRSWAAMNVDIDGAPLIGHLPSHPDCVVVAGTNGYTLGPMLGRHAADAVASGRQPLGLERFSPIRLTLPA
jgi:glycine/D-amino acid oxidase-like deaminating enzyme